MESSNLSSLKRLFNWYSFLKCQRRFKSVINVAL